MLRKPSSSAGGTGTGHSKHRSSPHAASWGSSPPARPGALHSPAGQSRQPSGQPSPPARAPAPGLQHGCLHASPGPGPEACRRAPLRRLSTSDAFRVTANMEPKSTRIAHQRAVNPASVRLTMMSLLTSAKKMFCRILAVVRRPRRTDRATLRRSESMSTTCALSRATCVPAAPIAKPMSAVARAAASLMPSPIMATAAPAPLRQQRCPAAARSPPPPLRAHSLSCCTAATLPSGSSSESTFCTPSCLATASAGARWSPVSMTASTPRPPTAATHSAAPRRAASAMVKAAASSPSMPTKQTA
mmetsp:Transcript_102351/g.305646  ORF Transcript_102351/g.305646 Transcript_102351/m.305646 type:complete len:302 (-) Transcript_102351:1143-2048(-)